MNAPWIRRALALVISVVVGVQGLVVAVHARDQVTPVTADAAVERFRATTTPVAPAAPPEPDANTPPETQAGGPASTVVEGPAEVPPPEGPPAANQPSDQAPPHPKETTVPPEGGAPSPPAHPRPGVYSYRTDGYEHVDALGGRRHDYPHETTITYTPDSCGMRALWAPLEERYDERLLCAGPGGTEMRWFESSHAFFGQSDTRRLVCDPSSVMHPLPATPGQQWSFRCADDRTEAVSRSRVVAVGPVAVADRTRTAVHVQVATTVTGDSRAESELDVWLDDETGLVLRQIFALDGTSPGPSGDVAYTERYELQLVSIEPRT